MREGEGEGNNKSRALGAPRALNLMSLSRSLSLVAESSHAHFASRTRLAGSGDGGSFFAFFFTLVTGPRRSLSLKLSDKRVYEPQIRRSFWWNFRTNTLRQVQELLQNGLAPLVAHAEKHKKKELLLLVLTTYWSESTLSS